MKKFLATLALATLGTLTLGQAAEASTSYHQRHYRLAMAAEAAGVSVRVNGKGCGEGSFGYYRPASRLIMICQEQATAAGIKGREVSWTAEDYDTLRHEVQHMIQDCMIGTGHDGRLNPVYNKPVAMAEEVLGGNRLRDIARLYGENGADEATIILEFEAFAVAALDNPEEQIGDVQRYCM